MNFTYQVIYINILQMLNIELILLEADYNMYVLKCNLYYCAIFRLLKHKWVS